MPIAKPPFIPIHIRPDFERLVSADCVEKGRFAQKVFFIKLYQLKQ
jgi:hypothetical protein